MNTFLLVFILQASIYNFVNSYESSHHNHHGHTSHKRFHQVKTKVIMPSGETHLVILPNTTLPAIVLPEGTKGGTAPIYSHIRSKRSPRVRVSIDSPMGRWFLSHARRRPTTLPAIVLPEGTKARHKYRKNHGGTAPVHSHIRSKRSPRVHVLINSPMGIWFLSHAGRRQTTLPAIVLPEGTKARHKYRKNHGGTAPVHSHIRSKRSPRVHVLINSPMGIWFLSHAGRRQEDLETRCDDQTTLIQLKPDGEFTVVAEEMERTRRTHSSGQFSGYNILKIEKIVNPCLWKRYTDRRSQVQLENGVPNEKLLYHGTPAWRDIINNGFHVRYANKNGMFGAGIYFSEISSKANQYVFGGNRCPTHGAKNCMLCERVLIQTRVTLGKVQQYTTRQHLFQAPPGYHSVEGTPSRRPYGLRYSENVIYKGDQAFPEFLITYKLKP